MDLITLCENLKDKMCKRWSDRQRRLYVLNLVRLRKHYAELDLADFDQQGGKRFGGKNDYKPLAERRPAIRFDMPGIIVRDSVSMLFSESKFPILVFENDADSDAAQIIVDKMNVRAVMKDAATIGSVGSVVIVPEVLAIGKDGKHVLFLDVWQTFECEPIFHRNDPGLLESLTRTWEVGKDALVADGYDYKSLEEFWRRYCRKNDIITVEQDNRWNQKTFARWYCRRELGEDGNVWYLPTPEIVYVRTDWDDWQLGDGDDNRSVDHGLGFVPALWITNLGLGEWPDGLCQFEASIDNSLMLDRVLSQGAQAIITAGSPILAISRPSGQNTFGAEDGGSTTSGASNKDITPDSILEVEESNGAWLVQMSADSTIALEAYVRLVRSLSIENCGGSRMSEESLTGAKSGYAMELLNQALIWLGENLRLSYGEPGLVALIRMIGKLNDVFPLRNLDGVTLSDTAAIKEISWGEFYTPSGIDKLAEVQSITAAMEGGLIDHETGIANAGYMFDVTDVADMLQKTTKEAEEKAQAELSNQVALVQAKPAPGKAK